MAAFLKIGSRVINLDLVTDMQLKDDQIVIYFAAEQGQKGDVRSKTRTFKGDSANALQTWLMKHWTDLGIAPESTGADSE